jgi:hypothetical protein
MDHEEGAQDEEVAVYGGADRVRAEAGGDGDAGGGGDPPDGCVGADVLSLEVGLWWAWRWRAATGQAA